MRHTFTSILKVTLTLTGRCPLNIKATLKCYTSLESLELVEEDGIWL